MIRRINKIVALALIITSITTVVQTGTFGQIAPLNTFCIEAKAATSDSSDQEAALKTVEAAMIPTKLNSVYSGVNTSGTVSEFEECGSLSYTLDDTAAGTIAEELANNMTSIVAGVKAVQTGGTKLIAYGKATGSEALVKKGTELNAAATTVLTELSAMSSLSEKELVATVQSEAKDIPVYKYTVTYGGSKVAQGFAVGGLLGLALNPSDTYNASEKTATYSSTALVPSLSLSDASSKYEQTIDLSASGTKIICDGLNINIVDSTNNKVYAINNPVYKMFNGTSSDTDTLNVVDFSSVTNLKGSTSSIDLSTEGITTTVLSISLTTENSVNKDYEYALPVETYEKTMLDKAISNMNLSDVGTTLQGMIQSGTYTMIPNLDAEVANLIDGSSIGDTIDDVTDGLDDLSDALDDFTDALEDKSDDVDDAWDKFFDRFDNDKGWGKRDGYRYYYDKDGVSLKGVQKINGKTYYFNRIDGAMETGWQIVDGKRCYFDKKKGYELFNQWISDNDDKYFLGEDGAVKKMEWVAYEGKYYYLKADGKMTKDWLKIDDYWYLFNQDGSMVTSTWKWSDGKWYYLKGNGAAANDWLQIGGNWYYFKELSGEMQTGWFRAKGSWYCANDDGSMKTGWADSNDGMCYLDETTGKMKKNEWVNVDGNWYYFNVNGIMVTGSRYIDGIKYNFNSDGSLS